MSDIWSAVLVTALDSLEKRSLCLLISVVVSLPVAAMGDDVAPATRALLSRYCTDCHGAPDQDPERGFAIGDYLGTQPVDVAGPLWKKAVNALEGFEMPPAGADQPSAKERVVLINGLREWLKTVQRPGRPVLRRLTRLEYNNTVRDLLGLDTDVFMFPERLPFDKTYFRPETGKMPSRLKMRAREYGGKYPVLLPNAGLPGDSRAEHGFSNRGDAQNTSAVRLEQYVSLAQQIMRHPELLSRARRLQEIFPEAQYEQPVVPASSGSNLKLVESVGEVAPNDNINKEATGNAFTLAEFRERLQKAFAENRGGVYDVSQGKGSTIPGKGAVAQIAYGENANRFIELNPSEDIWNVPFATAEESSGDALITNKVKGLKKFFFGIGSVKGKAGGGVVELGLVILSRRGQSGTVKVAVDYGDDALDSVVVELAEGAGKDNTFVSFKAPAEKTIKRLHIDGTEFSGDYVLLDDLAFITRDAPAGKQTLVGVEPPVKDDANETEPKTEKPQLDLTIATKPPRERLAHFMSRAFRRPVSDAEVSLYYGLYEEAATRGSKPADAMRETLAGVLASPQFLYVNASSAAGLFEPGQSGLAPASQRPATKSRPPSDHQLASRLSYFLWSSMPDDELSKLANEGRLSDPDVLEAQSRRMLKSVAVRELSENFFVEWLKLRELWSAQPDRRKYKTFYAGPQGKETLADDMFGEAILLFETILVEDRPVTELLNTDFTYTNSALTSRLYDFGMLPKLKMAGTGQPIGPLSENELKSASDWYRVQIPDEGRGGIMTMGATLTLTSFPTRTSPIKRGVWLLETIFNRPPSPPAFAVADIDEQEFGEELTIREKTKLHRDKPACAVCHDRIDPPGFALESFDGIGRFREKDGNSPIDDSGSVPGAGEFDGPSGFKAQLLKQKQRFVRGFAEKLLSYALCRELEYFDDPVVEHIVKAAADDDYRLSRIVVEIVRSHSFREVSTE